MIGLLCEDAASCSSDSCHCAAWFYSFIAACFAHVASLAAGGRSDGGDCDYDALSVSGKERKKDLGEGHCGNNDVKVNNTGEEELIARTCCDAVIDLNSLINESIPAYNNTIFH